MKTISSYKRRWNALPQLLGDVAAFYSLTGPCKGAHSVRVLEGQGVGLAKSLPMSVADQIKEEVGWLKLIFAALIAIEVSLIGWLAQNYTTVQPLIVVGAFVTVVAIGLGIVWVNRTAFRRIRQLRDL